MSEYAERAELRRVQDRLDARIDAIDHMGTRGVAVLAVQLQEIAKDVASLQNELISHRAAHEQGEREAVAAAAAAARGRVNNRRWIIGAVIALVAAIDSPLISVLLALHHG
jgi:hypothetical protein